MSDANEHDANEHDANEHDANSQAADHAARDAASGATLEGMRQNARMADRIRPDALESPWRTVGSRTVYRNPWFSVVEHDVIRPDGLPGLYCIADPGDNVTIAAVDGQERICLIRDFVYAFQTFDEFLPSGTVDPGEDPLTAARRELLEETGLTAADWSQLGQFRLSPGFSRQTSYIYLARGLTAGAARREPTERMTMRMVPLGEALDGVLQGAICSAVAALGIWRARSVLHPGGEVEKAGER